MSLSAKQRQFLKGLAHPLKPTVLLGANGLTEGVIAEIDAALARHELIKVKVPGDDREIRNAIGEAICRETGAEKVQTIGKTLILYRMAEEPVIQLPRR